MAEGKSDGDELSEDAEEDTPEVRRSLDEGVYINEFVVMRDYSYEDEELDFRMMDENRQNRVLQEDDEGQEQSQCLECINDSEGDYCLRSDFEEEGTCCKQSDLGLEQCQYDND